ncbi:glycosyltransferase involved in cell wall biosynthesis [Methanolinea mesophila]|uniref:glycosyltransferase family 4 protein n=1 Tax=Methanolinea mesophila TaxID=547055 RepID=UPI001AE94384|nr:glycosyltransferase family 4 protein [Methanolinea mesophila]MBP1928352.1 glycosyltransferase involved in cell wall biosynthesis [Methanolinea mesophila]
MSRLSVAILTPEFIPVRGGTGAYVEGLARNFPRDVDVHIVTPYVAGEPEKMISPLGGHITVHRLGTTSNSFIDNLRFQRIVGTQLPLLVEEYAIDIVHSQSALPDRYIDPRMLKVPIVTTIHSTIEEQIATIEATKQGFFRLSDSERYCILLSPFLKRIENKYYTSDRYFIAVSEWTRNQVIRAKQIDPEKITAIHNGVDPEKFRPREKEEAARHFPSLDTSDTLNVLFLSRMNASKGLYTYLDALEDISKNTHLHFIFAGPGEFPEVSLPGDSFTYLGPVDHDIAPYLYNLADVFILPSFYENFPISVLEAMASGLPVIASEVGGIPEMIRNRVNGILIPPRDPKRITESLIMLANDGTLRNLLGRNARGSVVSEFTWNHAATDTMNYYREILGRNNGDPAR